MIDNLASVCILSYERPDFLRQAIETARNNAGARCEIIVHDDGSANGNVYYHLNELRNHRQISRLLLNSPGHNQGVGESIRACFGVASGDVLIKADQDLIFKDRWLAKALDILWNVAETPEGPKEIGMLGLFHYQNLADERFRTVRQHNGWQEVTDFVGSAFIIRRDVYDKVGPIDTHSDAFAEDIMLKEKLVREGYVLALPDEDLAINQGFGVGPSTVAISEEGEVRAIHHSAILFNE